MKFSVLMSLYVKEQPAFLAECLASLTAQSYPADEIVILYDGKVTAELEAVVQQYAPILPLKQVRFAENRGLGNTLNDGLKYCSHEWVFRMDSDDICDVDRFAKQVAFIQQHPDVVVFGSQIAEFGQNVQDIVAYRAVPTTHQQIVKFSRFRCPFNHMTVAYQKSKVLAVGGYQGLQEDYTLWIKMIASGFLTANLTDVLVYARVGNGMVGRRRNFTQFKYEWQLYRLKTQAKLHSRIVGLGIFALRAIPRILPLAILQRIYKLLHK
ncbi:glycosyltransferase [[Haemophilus] ducreyi]|uniref:glycosyltransferase n=1 Tax=Haemophilus ducreyi TaxID=730 RepID=UPI00065654FC|nr:glycosyltransferase [[Haemophilus] ducreyi]AKO45309.1 amylovoran biosynthesis protein AmsE [[Haemophilus] ducreyi]AKO46694.1 amylovoran biosynthesis protein AmsE [[Haemophilus] ducreyi]AKO48035.1 amylovoran biosynthesis protein AmsE [[Haemophilus] ducreyi]AKO49422.1 amylovoran biosynthesis protein AmsE [[Haemophilus] ducreyi]ANF61540.1 amylovoran biosynthesis protein AmsE [[Haemophilus] ducreyi]